MDKIKVGVSATLTGKYSIQGIESFNGIKAWAEEKNSVGGIYVDKFSKKLPIELIFYDDKSITKNTENITKKLIKEHNVDILLGPYSSSLTLAAAKVSSKYNKTLWNYGGSSDEIFNNGFENIISSITPASHYFRKVIDFIISKNKKPKLAIVFAQDSGFSTQVAVGAINYAKNKNIEITKYTYKSGTKDFKKIIKDIIESNTQIILGVGRFEDDLAFASEIINQDFPPENICLAGSSIQEFKQFLKGKSEGFLSTSQWELNAKYKNDFGPNSEYFLNLFKKYFGKVPDYVAAQSYNIGIILEMLIDETGSIKDEDLRTSILEKTFTTFYGKFELDSNYNQIGHQMFVTQWQNGKKEIIFPDEHSTSNYMDL